MAKRTLAGATLSEQRTENGTRRRFPRSVFCPLSVILFDLCFLSCAGRRTLAGSASAVGGLSPVDLRCECVPDPLGVDVASMLERGENVLGVMLGNGMYNVPAGRYTKFKGTRCIVRRSL